MHYLCYIKVTICFHDWGFLMPTMGNAGNANLQPICYNCFFSPLYSTASVLQIAQIMWDLLSNFSSLALHITAFLQASVAIVMCRDKDNIQKTKHFPQWQLRYCIFIYTKIPYVRHNDVLRGMYNYTVGRKLQTQLTFAFYLIFCKLQSSDSTMGCICLRLLQLVKLISSINKKMPKKGAKM
jgi:hypothetical protein